MQASRGPGSMVPQEICWILTPVSPISSVSECDGDGMTAVGSQCINDCVT